MDLIFYFGYLFGIPFILLGLLMLSGRGTRLIAGYSTMNAQERAEVDLKYDMKMMTRMIGVMLILIGIASIVCFSGYIDALTGTVILLLAIFVPLFILIIGQFTFLRRDR